VAVVGFTALLYDHAITVPPGCKVNYIWNGRMGLVSIIFLFLTVTARPLVLVVDVYETIALATNTALFCKVWTAVQSYLTIASFMSIHAIVAWRLYALHGGQPWIGRLLWTAGIIYFVTSTFIVTWSLIPVIKHLHPVHHQCVSSIPTYLWTTWLPSVVFESLIFGLTLFALIRHELRHSFSSLSLLLYRDGMLYFVAVTFCSLFSLLVWALAGPAYLGLARYFALAMVNVAGSRLVLNLKGYTASRNAVDYPTGSRSLPYSAVGFGAGVNFGRGETGPSDDARPDDEESGSIPLDLEMYSIERDCQQLGTKLMRHD
ncbi:hypothetical protein BKA93DRAFT_740658, partial [Sparassis latifolia]